jgi:anti-sigma regulatory factor (Ser/Thr protein kinase)
MMIGAPLDDFAFTLNGGDGAGSAARRAIVAGDGALPAPVREDVLLLATELVANAVRHAGVGPDESLQVELRRRPRQVRVAVLDPGAGFEPPAPSASGDDPGGWGLVLLDRIADRWGVSLEPAGTCVWFEIDFER